MRAVRTGLLVSLVLAIAVPVMAQEKGKAPKKKREGKQAAGARAEVFPSLEGLKLTDEQKAKVEALHKELAPKVEEARKTMEGVVTPEQRNAAREAAKKAREAGKSPREIREAAEAAMNLTEEQKTKMAEAEKTLRAVREQYRAKVMEILTPEQKAELKERLKERVKRASGEGGMKKKAAKK